MTTTEQINDSITFAQNKLHSARRDGAYKDIRFWTKRVNELLDRKLDER